MSTASPGMRDRRRLRVLVLARNYPNAALPLLGLWTRGLVQCTTRFADVTVIAPIPYAPPMPALGPLTYYSRHRSVPRRRWDGDVEVLHPRMLVGPRASTARVEAWAYGAAVAPLVGALHHRTRFDLIHAHFTYPDGVVATALGRVLGIPTVISEHAPWTPWMEHDRVARRQGGWAAGACAAHVPVSRYVDRTIAAVTGVRNSRPDPVPPVVDGALFCPDGGGDRRADQILFVGAVRHSKGVDVLVEALPALARRRPGTRLVMVGEPFYASQRRELDAVLERARALGLAEHVEVVGAKAPAEVARLMAQSAVLVVPSRAESFGAVVIEALACGTPVVATRCGGPEEILNPTVGCLVAPEDPAGLAAALADVLEGPDRYDAGKLREHALVHFGVDVAAGKLAEIYRGVLGRRRAASAEIASA